MDKAIEQGCWPEPEVPQTVNRSELGNLQPTEKERRDLVAFLETFSDPKA